MYQEAFKKTRSNKIWNYIVNKTEWDVEIVLESNDYQFIKKKECEFIKLYGRIDLKKGILTNLTDGGEGCKGYIATDIHKKRISIANMGRICKFKGIPRTQQVKDRVSIMNKGKKRTDEEKEKIKLKRIGQNMSHLWKAILQFDMKDNFIQEFSNMMKAIKECNLTGTANLIACCKGKRKSTGGFIWKYKLVN